MQQTKRISRRMTTGAGLSRVSLSARGGKPSSWVSVCINRRDWLATKEPWYRRACRHVSASCRKGMTQLKAIYRSLPMDCPAVALFRQRLEASMPSQQIEKIRCCTGAPYMDCIDLAFGSFFLRALRNHVKQVQNESKTVDTHICNSSM